MTVFLPRISKTATVAQSARIGPLVAVRDRATVTSRVTLRGRTIIAGDAYVGRDSVVYGGRIEGHALVGATSDPTIDLGTVVVTGGTIGGYSVVSGNAVIRGDDDILWEDIVDGDIGGSVTAHRVLSSALLLPDICLNWRVNMFGHSYESERLGPALGSAKANTPPTVWGRRASIAIDRIASRCEKHL